MNTADKKFTGNAIEFWRIIFTLMIVLQHLTTFYPKFLETYSLVGGWYVGVEFFFIVSGYLLAKKSKEHNMTALQYQVNRFRRLYPMYILAFTVSFLFMNVCVEHNSITIIVYNLLHNADEVLMLQLFGTNKIVVYNIVTWYISAMFIAGYIVYWLVINHRKSFVEFIAPLSVMVIYSYHYRVYGSSMQWYITNELFLNTGLTRAFAGMSLGVIGYELSVNSWRDKILRHQKLLTFVEVMGYLTVIVVSVKWGRSTLDFLCILILSVCVPLSFQHEVHWKWTGISKYCYSIYLNHHIFCATIFPMFYSTEEHSFKILALYLIVVIVYSVILQILLDNILSVLRHRFNGGQNGN